MVAKHRPVPVLRDICVRHLYYTRSLQHAARISWVASIAMLTTGFLLWLALDQLGVFRESTELWDFVVNVVGIDPVWHWWMAGAIVLGVFVVNYVVFSLLTVINVWLFNVASDLTGGIVLRLEALSEVDLAHEGHADR